MSEQDTGVRHPEDEFQRGLIDLPPIPGSVSEPPEYRSFIIQRENEAFYARRYGMAWAKRDTHAALDEVLHEHEALARQFMVKFPGYAARVAKYGDIIVRLKMCRCRFGDDDIFAYSHREEPYCPDCHAAGVTRGFFANVETLTEHRRVEHDAAVTSPCSTCKRTFACLADQRAHDDENFCTYDPLKVGKFFFPDYFLSIQILNVVLF